MTFTDFPAKFGKYILLDRLAAGGMAEVFRAKVTGVEGFERLVAIKCMLPNMASDEHFTGMFVDEARLAAQVGHTNVVQIYELGREQERLYIAMELIVGRDLRHILKVAEHKNISLPPSFAAYVARKTAEGLDFAHRKEGADGRPLGLVHRDVSPQNILVSYDGDVKVVDFGIAKASTEARGTQTQVGILKGKFAYMAPEQVTGQPLDHRADIFALGSVLYEMVAGRRLFRGDSDLTVLEHVREAILPDFSVDLPPGSQRLVPVLNRALSLNLQDRFAWASEMAEALEPMLIEEQNIFGAKRAAALMRSLFPDEIQTLASDLKRFARVTVNDCVNKNVDNTDVSRAAPSARRMVFESTFAASQVGKSLRDDAAPHDRTGEVARPASLSFGSQPRLQMRRELSQPTAPRARLDASRRDTNPGLAPRMRPSRVASGQGASPVAAEPRAAQAERSQTQRMSRVKTTGDVMRQLRRVALGTLGVCGVLVLIVSVSARAPWQADGDARTPGPFGSLSALAQALRNQPLVDRWLFGGSRTAAGLAPTDVLPFVEDAGRLAGAKEVMVESALPSSVDGEGFLRVDVKGGHGVRVMVDGRDLGLAPLPPVQLSAGSHKVRVVGVGRNGRQQSKEQDIEVTTDDTQDQPASVDIRF